MTAKTSTFTAEMAKGRQPGPVTGELSRFVIGSDYARIGEKVRHEAVRSLVNWVGCAVGGARHATVEIALKALRDLGGTGDATLVGRRERLSPADAALINGMSSAVLDYDSTQAKFTNIHPSGPVVPAILAVAGMRSVSGMDFLHAYILGVEVACRLANGLFHKNNPGWHVTGVCGGFGAAAAAGRLLDLTQDQMVSALGTAATQAGGLREMYGTMCKSFTPGRAAQNGLLAAMLGYHGFSSAEQAIEGEAGFARVLTGRLPSGSLLDGLGIDYEISANTYKPFACAIVTHAAIDGCLRLRQKPDFSGDEIAQILLTVSPLTLKLAGNARPSTGLEAKFSVQHTTALALLNGKVSYRDFTDEAAGDARIAALCDRVSIVVDPDLAKDQAIVRLRLNNGQILTETIDHALGGLKNPMSDSAIEDKFMDLAVPSLGDEGARRLVNLCWDIGGLKDINSLLMATVPQAAGDG